jgi:hypothetical protein
VTFPYQTTSINKDLIDQIEHSRFYYENYLEFIQDYQEEIFDYFGISSCSPHFTMNYDPHSHEKIVLEAAVKVMSM